MGDPVALHTAPGNSMRKGLAILRIAVELHRRVVSVEWGQKARPDPVTLRIHLGIIRTNLLVSQFAIMINFGLMDWEYVIPTVLRQNCNGSLRSAHNRAS